MYQILFCINTTLLATIALLSYGRTQWFKLQLYSQNRNAFVGCTVCMSNDWFIIVDDGGPKNQWWNYHQRGHRRCEESNPTNHCLQGTMLLWMNQSNQSDSNEHQLNHAREGTTTNTTGSSRYCTYTVEACSATPLCICFIRRERWRCTENSICFIRNFVGMEKKLLDGCYVGCCCCWLWMREIINRWRDITGAKEIRLTHSALYQGIHPSIVSLPWIPYLWIYRRTVIQSTSTGTDASHVMASKIKAGYVLLSLLLLSSMGDWRDKAGGVWRMYLSCCVMCDVIIAIVMNHIWIEYSSPIQQWCCVVLCCWQLTDSTFG